MFMLIAAVKVTKCNKLYNPSDLVFLHGLCPVRRVFINLDKIVHFSGLRSCFSMDKVSFTCRRVLNWE